MTDWPSVHQHVVDLFAKGWAHPGPDAWDDMLAEDAEFAQPLLPNARGKVAWQDETRRLLTLAPDLHGEVVAWAGRDDIVFIDVEQRATVGGKPLIFRSFDKLRITPDGRVWRREAFFDPGRIALALLLRPSSWLPWWRSGTGPFTARRRLLKR
jgi:SnoaL-like domain